jgi:2,3-bisphosphoglycerate-dependent phosphoglycerate mutase
MKRTIPYLTEVILPKAVNENKRVLIASSENAIRGMLMKLCDIPEEMISELSIPNGVPMIYDVKSRCLKLLDDGSGVDPLEKYNFGPAAPYLFREREPEVEDELCDLEALSEEAQRNLSEVYSSVKTTLPSEATRLPESLWS